MNLLYSTLGIDYKTIFMKKRNALQLPLDYGKKEEHLLYEAGKEGDVGMVLYILTNHGPDRFDVDFNYNVCSGLKGAFEAKQYNVIDTYIATVYYGCEPKITQHKLIELSKLIELANEYRHVDDYNKYLIERGLGPRSDKDLFTEYVYFKYHAKIIECLEKQMPMNDDIIRYALTDLQILKLFTAHGYKFPIKSLITHNHLDLLRQADNITSDDVNYAIIAASKEILLYLKTLNISYDKSMITTKAYAVEIFDLTVGFATIRQALYDYNHELLRKYYPVAVLTDEEREKLKKVPNYYLIKR